MLLPSAPRQQHDRNLTGPMQRGLLGSRAQQENPATGSRGGVPQGPNDNVLMSWVQGLGQGFCAPVQGGGTSLPPGLQVGRLPRGRAMGQDGYPQLDMERPPESRARPLLRDEPGGQVTGHGVGAAPAQSPPQPPSPPNLSCSNSMGCSHSQDAGCPHLGGCGEGMRVLGT